MYEICVYMSWYWHYKRQFSLMIFIKFPSIFIKLRQWGHTHIHTACEGISWVLSWIFLISFEDVDYDDEAQQKKKLVSIDYLLNDEMYVKWIFFPPIAHPTQFNSLKCTKQFSAIFFSRLKSALKFVKCLQKKEYLSEFPPLSNEMWTKYVPRWEIPVPFFMALWFITCTYIKWTCEKEKNFRDDEDVEC